jgi:hypothetical protein
VNFLLKFIAHTLPTFAVRHSATQFSPAIERQRAVFPLWKTNRNHCSKAMVVCLTGKSLRLQPLRSSAQIDDFNVFVRYAGAERQHDLEMCPRANTVARATSAFSSTPKLFFNFSFGSFLGS